MSLREILIKLRMEPLHAVQVFCDALTDTEALELFDQAASELAMPGEVSSGIPHVVLEEVARQSMIRVDR